MTANHFPRNLAIKSDENFSPLMLEETYKHPSSYFIRGEKFFLPKRRRKNLVVFSRKSIVIFSLCSRAAEIGGPRSLSAKPMSQRPSQCFGTEGLVQDGNLGQTSFETLALSAQNA